MGTCVHTCECSELHIHQGCNNNMPQTDHLNDKRVFLPVLDAGKFKIKVLSDSVPGGSPLPVLQTATFSLCPHLRRRVQEKQGFCCLFF